MLRPALLNRNQMESSANNTETRLTASLREYKNPVVVFCIGLLIGFSIFYQELQITFLIIAILSALILSVILKNKKLTVLAISILIGFLYPKICIQKLTPNINYLLNNKYIFAGEICDKESSLDLYQKKYYLKVNKIVNSETGEIIKKDRVFKVLVQGSKYEEYNTGDYVQVTGKLTKPKANSLPGFFNEKKYLLRKNIFYAIKAEYGTLIYLDTPGLNPLISKLRNIRTSLIKINEQSMKKENASIVNGIVFGSKTTLIPAQIYEKIHNLGLSHITSASGFNISIIIILLASMFKAINFRNKVFSTVITIFFVGIYCFMADFSSSVLRSGLFIVLALTGEIFNKKVKLLPGLSFITILFFISNPMNLLDVGLQLSIAAFLGIQMFVNDFIKDNKNFFTNIFAQSFFAQLLTAPLIAYYFHNIQIWGLLSNIVAVPIASFILIAGVVNLFLSYIPFVNSWINYLLISLSSLFLYWVELLDRLPCKNLFVPFVDFYSLIIILILLILTISLMVTKKLNFKNIILIVIAFAILFGMNLQDKALKIFFIPKYNQEAILILPPHEKAIYISTSLTEKNKKEIKRFLMLNNKFGEYCLYDLKNNNSLNLYKSRYVKSLKKSIDIQYNNFNLQIIKSYDNFSILSNGFVKLPMLKSKTFPLKAILNSMPDYLIINDYKRLSKKSKADIEWLKSLPVKTIFLSESGLVSIITNGKKHTISTGS